MTWDQIVANGAAETALGRLRFPDDLRDASSVIVGIRPEHILIGMGENSVSCRVTGLTYLGQQQRVTLRTSQGDTEMPIVSGQALTVSLPAERLRIVANEPPVHEGVIG